MTDGYQGTENLEVMAEARRYNKFLEDIALEAIPRGGMCLDYGAGIGSFALALESRGLKMTAFDPDEAHCRYMTGLGLRVAQETHLITDGFFDGVVCFNVLEHIQDDVSALQDIYRLLKPGGVLIAYVPAMGWLWSAMDDLVGHHRRYTRGSLCAKVRDVGFRVRAARYADSLGILATLLYRVSDVSDGRISLRSVKLYDSFAFPVSLQLDRALHAVVGKNVYVVCQKPGT